jgi:hypothetical protein
MVPVQINATKIVLEIMWQNVVFINFKIDRFVVMNKMPSTDTYNFIPGVIHRIENVDVLTPDIGHLATCCRIPLLREIPLKTLRIVMQEWSTGEVYNTIFEEMEIGRREALIRMSMAGRMSGFSPKTPFSDCVVRYDWTVQENRSFDLIPWRATPRLYSLGMDWDKANSAQFFLIY